LSVVADVVLSVAWCCYI